MEDNTMRKRRALITGGSGGIGLEIARQFAAQGASLFLVARDEGRLAAAKADLEHQYGTEVLTLALDLAKGDAVTKLIAVLEKGNHSIDYLINNAGFGDYGPFVSRDHDKYREMLQVNVVSLVELTHYVARQMQQRGSGSILNVASTAGFQPDPNFAVYGASKAFVINFSEALSYELRNSGVSCTVLSPGVTETGFMQRADMKKAKIFQSGVMQPADVARAALRGIRKRSLHVVPGLKNAVMAFFSSITPSGRLRLMIAAKVMAESKK